ncbi:DUF3114 domain-containing protein [Streptococcus loxodontisalivarius]|uniref:DUF3114 domain-containing protein n=1 Tax=Streptococcus loxodontisalivarius TaxID=1349415 RepID=A0ABS2PQM1_9STRE|nr:DUF3114 domain-containing protein [Streptococcus loxodontisalivarius]MBM7642346.1 hypothetical protein [Streptococcus loxodontisalivarius]
MLIGDKEFSQFWLRRKSVKSSQSARILLKDFLDLIGMPKDLSGDLAENKKLVARFSSDLAPHNPFFRQLADLVNLAFPGLTLAQPGSLERKIHQLRYVISSQQADYVRRHYRKDDMNDWQALALYLKGKRFWTWDLGRLHNKRHKKDTSFPDGIAMLNSKIILGYHTEFILSSQGYFLNEVDTETFRLAGIVNGASFNYGRWWRHAQLDVAPISQHDPQFRKKLARSYKSPSGQRPLFRPQPHDGLYAKTGSFSQNQQSLAKQLKRQRQQFCRAVKKS